jgi:hypothetical protein
VIKKKFEVGQTCKTASANPNVVKGHNYVLKAKFLDNFNDFIDCSQIWLFSEEDDEGPQKRASSKIKMIQK